MTPKLDKKASGKQNDKKMKALVLGNSRLRLREVSGLQHQENEALVKVPIAGICDK